MAKKTIEVHLPRPHAKQDEFINSPAKRKIIRAGRRSGKTVGISIAAVKWFLDGDRVLYTAPTMEQVGRFWSTVTRALHEAIRRKVLRKNESEHFIEVEGTEQRIKAKTSWNADTLRGDYAGKLIFDEWQLMNEDAWGLVGAPMLLDNDGDAIFIYTPPSLHSRSVSKANDPQHAAKLFKKAQNLQNGGSTRWAAFHFTSKDNPHLSKDALDEITGDMSSLAYRMEIMAEDVDEAPGALWTRKTIDDNRVLSSPHLSRLVVSVDPSTTSAGDEAGLVVCGKNGDHGYIIADESIQGSPLVWAKAAVTAYHKHKADLIVAEKNQGGEMVELTIRQVDPDVNVKLVHASRGKQARAEPVSAKAEKGMIHHVGNFPVLEDELCLWTPGDSDSPNRLDAMVWGMTELMFNAVVNGMDLS
uniref:Putative terminase n=1 Tax=viral metagenome TaxID=1070528 RepID=A0A6M3JR00_9ZZZZ